MLAGDAMGSTTLDLFHALFLFSNLIVRDSMLGQRDFWPDSAILKQMSLYRPERIFVF